MGAIMRKAEAEEIKLKLLRAKLARLPKSGVTETLPTATEVVEKQKPAAA